MYTRIAATACCLLLLVSVAHRALAQDLPQECKDALQTRSPQAQVDLFTRCLDTNRLSGATKATTLKQRAVAYMHLGQHPRAIEDINQAIKLKSDDSDSYYLRGFAYRALGQYQRAVEDSTRAIGLESNFAAAFANRAFAYKALGNVTQARSDARRARDLDPSVKVPSF
jgi:tetratricopeptide (TPR) repeat protein